MTALLTRLIEDQLAHTFKLKKIPLSKYLTLQAAADLANTTTQKLHDYLKDSKQVHAAYWNGEFYIHPESFRKYLARRFKSAFLSQADDRLKTLFRQKTRRVVKHKQSLSADSLAEGELSVDVTPLKACHETES